MRSPADRSSSLGRASWKQRGATTRSRPSSSGGRSAARWFLTLLLLALIGGFAVWVWPNSRGVRHLVATTIWATDPLTLPPLAFAREDLDALARTPDVQFTDATSSGQDATNFLDLLQQSAQRAKSPNDAFLLYLSAHGLTDSQGPFLAASDFWRGPELGRVRVRDLLDRFEHSPAQTKVLFLDASRLDLDPRLGQFGNDFASQLIAEVQRHTAKNVWIVLASGPGQGTLLDPAIPRSVFSQAITDGLAGAATLQEQGGDGDRFVDIGELIRFVRRHCSSAAGAELPDFQTPLLLRTGVGLVEEEAWPFGKEHRLVYIDPSTASAADAPPAETPSDSSNSTTGDKSTPPPAADSTPASSSPSGNRRGTSLWKTLTHGTLANAWLAQGEPAAAPAPQPSSTPPAAPAATPAVPAPAEKPSAPESAPAPATPSPTPVVKPAEAPAKPLTPPERMRAELLRLWTLRDQLASRSQENALTPIDFAPHLWREAEGWLLYYEQRWLAGRIGDSAQAGDARDLQEADLRWRDMRALADDLEQLAKVIQGATPTPSADEKSIGDRLLGAWTRYARERLPEDRKFERESDPLLREVRSAAWQLREQAYHAVDWTRWYGHSAASGTVTPGLRAAVASHLLDIGSGIQDLRRLSRAPLPPSAQSDLRLFLQRQARRAEQRQALAEQLDAVEQEVLRATGQPGANVRLFNLLSTPLLPAPQRASLWTAWLRRQNTPETPQTGTSRTGTRAAENGGGNRLDLRRLVDLRRDTLQLEAKLIAFVDPELAQRLDVLTQAAGPGEAPEAEQKRLLDAVRESVTFADALPRALTNEWTLLLLDPRDVPAIDLRQTPMPVFGIELETTAQLELVPLAKQLRYVPGQETRLSLTVRATKPNLLDSRLALVNSDGLLTMELLPDEDMLPTERGWYAKRVHYRVMAKPGIEGERKNSTQVAVTAEAGGLSARATVEIGLPRPNRVDILVTRLGAVATETAVDEVRLGVFANRQTKFKCELVNQHDEPRTVQVTLYAIAPRVNAQAPIGRLDAAIRRTVYDGASREFLDAKPVARSEKPIELPAANPDPAQTPRVTFNWVNPNAPPPAAPPAAGAPPVAAAAPPAAPPEPIHGLVLEVVDTRDATKSWLRWVELDPLSPRDYLEIAVGYHPRLRQIIATLKPKLRDASGQPLLPPGKPVWAEWDPSEARLPSEGKKNLAGEMDATADNPQVVLTAEVEPDGMNRIVKIGIDGYPRAFLYRVPCRRDATTPDVIVGDDLERETTAIKIESVTVPSQKRVYHFLPDFQPPPPPADDKAPVIEHLLLSPRQAALFRAPAETIVVKLQADAPIDAFRSESDRVQVTLRENSFTRTVRADREFRAFFVGAGPRGVFELGTAVGDLEIRLMPGDLQNVQSAIDADIRFDEQSDTDTILVNLDGDDPRIETLTLPNVAPKDGMITARFAVADYHGVAQVIYGFSKDGSPRLAEADAKPLAVTSRQDANRRHVFDLPLDLKDLPAGKRLFLAKVVDHVGHESKLLARELSIAAPQPMATTGEIRGVIRFGPAKVNGSAFKMTIEGGDLGPTPVEIGPNGEFLVPDLPIAEYTLKVLEGSFSGKSVPPKEQKGVKPTDPKKQQTIVLNVQPS